VVQASVQRLGSVRFPKDVAGFNEGRRRASIPSRGSAPVVTGPEAFVELTLSRVGNFGSGRWSLLL
jgi:hypothetical protein